MRAGAAAVNPPKTTKKKKAAKPNEKLPLKKALKKFWPLYIMIGIVMLYYFIFNYIPIIMGTVLSFKDMKVGNTIWNAKFVGWDNYVEVFQEPEMLNLIKNTLEISIMRLFWGFWPPILLAICIFDILTPWYKKFCQTMVYIPYFFSWVIVYGIVFAFFSGNGLINSIMKDLGMGNVDFLTSKDAFRPLLIGSQVWKGVGWGTILYFAALTNVSPDLYDAAKVDGAGPLRKIMAITLPTMMPIITFQLIMSLGSILNNDFEQILMYYNAGVYEVADIIDTWVYRVGLGKMQYSIGQAVTMMKAVIGMVLILSSNYISNKVAGRGMW